MVSTRGPKPKFDIGERVLCYEPDPKKIKMLYDAKVLDLRPSQKGSPDEKSRSRGFDYFVHFQGWSSTWDRFVATDMLLKDNELSRKEQRLLYEQTEEFRIRQEKKRKRKSLDKTRTSLDSNPSPVPSDSSEFIYQSKRGQEERLSVQEDDEIQFNRFRIDQRMETGGDVSEPETDTQTEPSESPRVPEIGDPSGGGVGDEKDGDEDICTEPINLNLPAQLKEGLEADFNFISDGRLVKLPAQPNIITLLEGFVRNYAINKLAALEKQNQKYYNQYRQPDKQESELFDDVVTNINIAKEVAEGVRIIIDFHLGNLLLYPEEVDQFIKSKSIRPHMESIERLVAGTSPLPPHPAANAAKQKPAKKPGGSEAGDDVGGGKKKSTRPAKKESESEPAAAVPGSVGSGGSGAETPNTTAGTGSQGQYPQTKKSHRILQDLYAWKLVPEHVYFEEPVPPCLIYGGVHLARVLVRIPDLFVRMRFPNQKLKYLTRYLEFLVDYLTTQEDIFSDTAYTK